MKWIARILGAVLLLVLTVFAVGAALPREHVAVIRATYPVAADSLFAAVANIAASAAWRSDVDSVHVLDTEPLRWREIGRNGAITYIRESALPPRSLVHRIDDAGQPFGGTWRWEIEPRNDSTTVTVTEEGWVSNPLFRFLARFVFGHYAALESYAHDLGGRFRTEVEPVRIEP